MIFFFPFEYRMIPICNIYMFQDIFHPLLAPWENLQISNTTEDFCIGVAQLMMCVVHTKKNDLA